MKSKYKSCGIWFLGAALIGMALALPTFSENRSTGPVSGEKSREQKLGKIAEAVRVGIRDMVVGMALTEEYFKGFVLRQMGKGKKIVVSEDSIKALKGSVTLVDETKTHKLSLPTMAELDIEIRAACRQLTDPRVQTLVEDYLERASYAEKRNFLEGEEKIYLNSPDAGVRLQEDNKKDDEKECREACDTVCTYVTKKVCKWVCEDTGWPIKRKCEKKCEDVVEEKCKEVCHWVCK